MKEYADAFCLRLKDDTMVLYKQTRLFQQKFLLEHQYHMLNELILRNFHKVIIDEDVK